VKAPRRRSRTRPQRPRARRTRERSGQHRRHGLRFRRYRAVGRSRWGVRDLPRPSLRRETVELRADREILRKAAAYFARETMRWAASASSRTIAASTWPTVAPVARR